MRTVVVWIDVDTDIESEATDKVRAILDPAALKHEIEGYTTMEVLPHEDES